MKTAQQWWKDNFGRAYAIEDIEAIQKDALMFPPPKAPLNSLGCLPPGSKVEVGQEIWPTELEKVLAESPAPSGPSVPPNPPTTHSEPVEAEAGASPQAPEPLNALVTVQTVDAALMALEARVAALEQPAQPDAPPTSDAAAAPQWEGPLFALAPGMPVVDPAKSPRVGATLKWDGSKWLVSW